ncbi:ferritin-like domain-containing protein [Mycena floridula]|nr:ferritin-like domain-containing protein [Mycena floridula]
MFSTTFTTFVFAALLLVSPSNVLASPSKRADPAITDTTVLQYALTLEHIENAFYAGALAKFDDSAFTNAGMSSTARPRFAQIGAHEAAHVAFLSKAIGDSATKPCTYNFPYTDPKSFAALAMLMHFTGVGVSAYTGAAQYITTPGYLTAAASVLATEARHAAWVASAINKQQPWSGALDVPLDLDQVYTLAAQFITSCPDSNPSLPVKAFPALTLGTGSAGDSVAVTYNTSAVNATGNSYVAFFTGLSVEYAQVQDMKVTIPKDLVGTVYAVLTSSGDAVSDNNTLAGVAVLPISDGILEPNSTTTATLTGGNSNGAMKIGGGAAVALVMFVAALLV